MRKIIFILALGVLWLAPQQIQACSCLQIPSVCESTRESKAVFSGTVRKVVQSGDGLYKAYLQVEKVYKGEAPKVVEFGWGDTSCDLTMEAGERWLIYSDAVDKKTKTDRLSQCGRSRVIEDNFDEDLIYLENLQKVQGKTRLAGNINYLSGAAVAGANVKIIGENAEYETATNRKGFFEYYGLPAGFYVLKPALPDGAKIQNASVGNGKRYFNTTNTENVLPAFFLNPEFKAENSLKLKTEPEKCLDVKMDLSLENFAKGRVSNHAGKPLTDVCVVFSRLGADLTTIEEEVFACVNDNGQYLLGSLPAGKYLLSVRKGSYYGLDKTSDIAPVFYPSTLKRAEAQILEIGAGFYREDLNVLVPKEHPFKLIEGRLEYADRQPVKNHRVTFNYREKGVSREIETQTDEQGKFSFVIARGLKGQINASEHFAEDELQKCPHLKRFITTKIADLWDAVETRPLPLTVEQDLENLKLQFPHAPCPAEK